VVVRQVRQTNRHDVEQEKVRQLGESLREVIRKGGLQGDSLRAIREAGRDKD